MYNTKEVVTSILSILIGKSFDDSKLDVVLTNEYNIDSLDMIELMLILEDKLDINLDDIDVMQLKTAREIINWVDSRR